jgi:hypothetical protein
VIVAIIFGTTSHERLVRGLKPTNCDSPAVKSPNNHYESLPRYLAPLPRKIETVALRYAWVIVAINLAGTAFGFWYYPAVPTRTGSRLAGRPGQPDSHVVHRLLAGAIQLSRSNEYLNMLAFLGCIKLGLWTPYALTVFAGIDDRLASRLHGSERIRFSRYTVDQLVDILQE